MLDPKAVKILFSAYWSPNGWKDDRRLSAEEFAFAKSAGVMFDPVQITHNDAVKKVNDITRALSPALISSAFLASLSSRRLDLRSALGSFAVGRHLPVHGFDGMVSCNICGAYNNPENVDLNVLNFERLKWGGVRHCDPTYIGLDLELFGNTEVPDVSANDKEIFLAIIQRAKSLPASARARDLEKALAGLFKSNKAEREVLLQILGYAGVFEVTDKPSFFDGFVYASKRDLPPASKIDWNYPFAWWRGSDGVNENAISEWFAHILN